MAAANPFARYADNTILDDDQGKAWIVNGGKISPYKANSDPTAMPKDEGTKQDQSDLSDYRTEAGQSLNAATEAQRFMRVNEKHRTGGFGGIGLPYLGTFNDIGAAGNPELARMRSITNRVAPNLRPAGSGSSSDKDTAVYISGFPNINAPPEANRDNEADWHTKSDHDAARSAYADVYFAKRGTLLGFPTAFNKFWAQRQASGKSVYGDSASPVSAPAPRPMARPAAAPAAGGWGQAVVKGH